METNQKCGDGLTGTQKEAALRALIQSTGYQLHQVGATTDNRLQYPACPASGQSLEKQRERDGFGIEKSEVTFF